MEGYEYLGWKEGDLPVTEKQAKNNFYLPMYPHLSYDEQTTFIETLKIIL